MATAGQLDMLAGVEKTEPPGPIADEAFAIWNEMAQRFGWVKANHNKHGRPAQLRRAVKDCGGIHQWRALLEKCGTSDFLCGRTNSKDRKPFSFNLDWCLKPSNLTKIEDGNYFSAAVRGAAPTETFSQRLAKAAGTDWKKRLQKYKPGGFWHVETEGPRPEHPGPHHASVELIEQWRKYYKVAEPTQQTREQRLAFLIESHRKRGNYKQANDLESELAQIEGRDAVLVPAPEVARHGMDKMDGRAFDEVLPIKPPPYRPKPRPSEAEATRAMAAAQEPPTIDADYQWAMDQEGEYGDE